MDIGMIAPGQQDWNRNNNIREQIMESITERNKMRQDMVDQQFVKANEANKEQQAVMEARQPQRLLDVLA